MQIIERVEARSAGYFYTLILKEDNTLSATGQNEYGQLWNGNTTDVKTPEQIMEGVKTIAAGYEHTLIFKKDNTLWATGANGSGQLGDGSSSNTTIPVQISF